MNSFPGEKLATAGRESNALYLIAGRVVQEMRYDTMNVDISGEFSSSLHREVYEMYGLLEDAAAHIV